MSLQDPEECEGRLEKIRVFGLDSPRNFFFCQKIKSKLAFQCISKILDLSDIKTCSNSFATNVVPVNKVKFLASIRVPQEISQGSLHGKKLWYKEKERKKEKEGSEAINVSGLEKMFNQNYATSYK